MGAGVKPNGPTWQANIRLDGTTHYLGTYESQEAAARAYDLRAKEEYEDPILNYLPNGQLNPNRKKGYNKKVDRKR